ncbi:hypothetical protein JEQ21_09790 [Streptococcus sp. 121]|uniref:hypothetical protein n=1 Tax=Streptococcus sp. 121 TaxID=2797637 RepID=UPI0018F0BFC5|nr:hypothetical protein [Streptococcus sp. 121]MBJ6746714.1 hypothetical protein [Streptococcus sp. 121]
MKLVKIDTGWVKPSKVIMVEETEVNPLDVNNSKIWTRVILEDAHVVHTQLSVDEVVAIINGGLE